KTISAGYFVPSVVRENIKIVIHVDISGSIGQRDYDDAIAEILGIGRSFENISMIIIFADCGRIKEENVLEVTNGNIETITEKKVKGGGGTEHTSTFRYIDENIHDCKLLISITDGYSDIERLSQPDFNVIWIISKNVVRQPFQFGETIFLED
ncbi:MAG: VWA-like domain-containing protein, partial [Nanoarchaeota archaeon]